MLASGRIGDQYLKRCTVPVQGTGSPNVFIDKKAASVIGKRTLPYKDKVPCPTCCKPFVATVFTGSPKVFVNGLAVGRISSKAQGISIMFPERKGSSTVFVT